MKTILAPVDFSAVSDAVVKEAAALARSFDGRVVLLTVVQPPVMVTEYAAMMDLSQVMAAGEKNAARQLEVTEDKLKSEFIKTETVQITGNPVPVIVEEAEKQDADYIVMGSHGHTAFYDLLVGSTTHGVLMRAKCPVVIVPALKESPKPPKKAKRLSVA
jgi:nucleotide-binding universal stress UspA family protein